MKLVKDAGNWWKWWSIRFMALAATVEIALQAIPPEALVILPEPVRNYITLALAVCAIISRVVDQGLSKENA